MFALLASHSFFAGSLQIIFIQHAWETALHLIEAEWCIYAYIRRQAII